LAAGNPASSFGTVDTVLPDDLAGERMRGLPERAAALVERAHAEVDRQAFADAAGTLATLRMSAPDHPEVLRLGALLDMQAGSPQRAIAALERALALRGDDAFARNELGEALRAAGHLDAAYAAWEEACRRKPDSVAAWFNLAWNLDRDGRYAQARAALERVAALAPDFAAAHMMLGDVLVMLGESGRAVSGYRAALRAAPHFGEAWCSLANIRSARFGADDLALMEQIDRREDLGEQSHAALEFALAKGYEDAGRHADAFATFGRANARMRRLRPWDPRAFDAHVDEVLAAFSAPHAAADDVRLGGEAIFIIGVPRSGSTLIEQILASHPQVEGADELPDLMQVIREESARRGSMFPRWVAAATPADWSRLGRRYLELTARWRIRRPVFTDKQPFNWLLAGAALAMLPAARIIDCRRDPVETCWSCYRQVFPEGAAFSYDLEHIVAFLAAHDRAAARWRALARDRVREQSYEALLADPEGQTRELLAFCGLDFDPACLQFQRTERVVRTTSAAQVREPLRSDTARSGAYGELLDPLRRMLARAR
jgi:tetratricopeptide (TPR) repeat protein